MNKSPSELLGQMVDLSVKPIRMMEKTMFVCVFCGDRASVPTKVEHKHNCIVAQAQDCLRNL